MREFFHRIFNGRYGSYGIDRLTRFLLILAAICLVLSILIPPIDCMYYISFLFLILCLFRLFSKKVTKRYNENEQFLLFEKRIISFFKKT